MSSSDDQLFTHFFGDVDIQRFQTQRRLDVDSIWLDLGDASVNQVTGEVIMTNSSDLTEET